MLLYMHISSASYINVIVLFQKKLSLIHQLKFTLTHIINSLFLGIFFFFNDDKNS